MKIKSIILSGALLLAAGAATTSCEDMFTVDNHLVTTDLAPQDTVYQMMGIVQRMQKLADRTVLLGEVRADLVAVDPLHAPAAIQELGNNAVSAGNIYNQPVDYYNVINACNIYLHYVDSLRSYLPSMDYYDKEILAAKCFRAWCYLELVKIYGEVPYVDEPVLTADAAEQIVTSGNKAGMEEVLTKCIKDLTDFMNGGKSNRWAQNLSLRPSYGSQKWNGISYDNFFIPVRVMLGELYLWRGACTSSREDYLKAIQMYHDYFCFPSEERSVQSYNAYWYDRNFTNNRNSTYINRFSVARTLENAAVLPCDTIEYFGNVSDLRSVFNSQYSNNYYPAVVPSQRLKNLSKSQQYCSYNIISGGDVTYSSSHNVNEYEDPIQEGDLRLSQNYVTMSRNVEDQTSSVYNNTSSLCVKWANGSATSLTTDVRGQYIPLYRNTILYLHMAEALNRAGFPETAYAVLAYGLSFETLQHYVSMSEFAKLCDIKTTGFNLTEDYYQTYYSDEETAKTLKDMTANSFAVWPHNVFRSRTKVAYESGGVRSWTYFIMPTYIGELTAAESRLLMQQGIHSLGSGDTEYNAEYQLDDEETLEKLRTEWPLNLPDEPKYGGRTKDPDSLIYKEELEVYQAAVEEYLANYQARRTYLASAEIVAKRMARVKQMILDEEALEGMFEGTRFYDLMRYQMAEGKLSGASATISLPDYLEPLNEGWTDNMTGKPWYLTLPSR